MSGYLSPRGDDEKPGAFAASSSSTTLVSDPTLRARSPTFKIEQYSDLETPECETTVDVPLMPSSEKYYPESTTRPTRSRKRCLITLVLFVLVLAIAGTALFTTDTHTKIIDKLTGPPPICDVVNTGNHLATDIGITKPLQVNGDFIAQKKTKRFRDALLPHQKYITSFLSAGWTNDVMAVMNTLYLASLTRRIVVLPPFQPSHIGHHAGLIDFSDVFSIEQFTAATGIPAVEWKDIKDLQDPTEEREESWRGYYGGEKEELGCWSVWMTQSPTGGGPRGGSFMEGFNLSVSWTPVPFGYTVPHNDSQDYSTHIAAALGWPGARKAAIENAKSAWVWNATAHIQLTGGDPDTLKTKEIPTPNEFGNQIDPDEHLLCYDYTYFMATSVEAEWYQEWTPAWHDVGRHLRWSDKVIGLVTPLLRTALLSPEAAVNASEPLPPYISVHIRRNDLSGWCITGISREDCLAPLSTYHRRVEEIRSLLPLTEEEKASVKVLVFSDEPLVTPPENPGYQPGECEAWWEAVRKLGWLTISHDENKTVEKYGEWYPSILDAAMLSLATGMVGTGRSTYSLLAVRRVMEWTNGQGAIRMVRWGWPGADEGALPPSI